MIPIMPHEFVKWLEDSNLESLEQFIEYLLNLEGEGIEVRRMRVNHNVIADSNRPYLHWLKENTGYEGFYIGIQGQSITTGSSDYDWVESHNLYLGHNLPVTFDVISIPYDEYIEGNSYFAWVGFPIRGRGHLSKYEGAANWGEFINGFKSSLITPGLKFQSPTWKAGTWGGGGNSKVWYLDEIMGGINMFAINWLDNPLQKHITDYRLYLEEEKKRLATLKRKEKIDSELSSYATYKTRKEIKFNNKKIELLKGKCSDGIYFDLVKINYIINKYRNNDVDIFANTKHTSFNIELHGIISQLTNLTNPGIRETNNNGWWPQFHRFMIDLCGEGYNLRSSHEGWDSGISNWTTWGVRDVGSAWFIELMNSGLDLSYYILDEVDKSHYGENIKMAEDTLIFDFCKKGGPLSKSKYYNYIRKSIEWYGTSEINHLLPKWMFIEYKGGQSYKL